MTDRDSDAKLDLSSVLSSSPKEKQHGIGIYGYSGNVSEGFGTALGLVSEHGCARIVKERECIMEEDMEEENDDLLNDNASSNSNDKQRGARDFPSSLDTLTLFGYSKFVNEHGKHGVELLDRGRFSKVFLSRNGFHVKKILECSDTDAIYSFKIANEVECNQRLLNENTNWRCIAQVFSVRRDISAGWIELDLECVSRYPIHIFSLLPWKGYPIGIAFNFCCQLAEGVAVLHELGIIHGDLRPENILLKIPSYLQDLRETSLDDFQGLALSEIIDTLKHSVIKIIDFGNGKVNDSSEAATTFGLLRRSSSVSPDELKEHRSLLHLPEPCYCAPEVCNNPQTALSQMSDCFSLGVLFHECFFGIIPSRASYANSKPKDIETGIWEGVPLDIRNLIFLLIASLPSSRPTAISAGHTLLTVQDSNKLIDE